MRDTLFALTVIFSACIIGLFIEAFELDMRVIALEDKTKEQEDFHRTVSKIIYGSLGQNDVVDFTVRPMDKSDFVDKCQGTKTKFSVPLAVSSPSYTANAGSKAEKCLQAYEKTHDFPIDTAEAIKVCHLHIGVNK